MEKDALKFFEDAKAWIIREHLYKVYPRHSKARDEMVDEINACETFESFELLVGHKYGWQSLARAYRGGKE